MKILVCDSGSSSLKFSLIEAHRELLLAEGNIDWTTQPTRLVFRLPGQPEIREELHLREHGEALGRILADLQAGPSAPLAGIEDIEAVGHRVVHGGRQFTSMGFTPMEGAVMGTRSGSLDPGVLLYLLRRKGLTVEQLDYTLNHESGQLGVSGISSDMRQILKKAPNSADARLALEVYIHRLVQTIGAMAATLGGVDGLAFTAGVGENSAQVRKLVCENLGHLGLELDTTANALCKPDADIASRTSPGRILVISTREDLTLVRETKRLICSEGGNRRSRPTETINSNN